MRTCVYLYKKYTSSELFANIFKIAQFCTSEMNCIQLGSQVQHGDLLQKYINSQSYLFFFATARPICVTRPTAKGPQLEAKIGLCHQMVKVPSANPASLDCGLPPSIGLTHCTLEKYSNLFIKHRNFFNRSRHSRQKSSKAVTIFFLVQGKLVRVQAPYQAVFLFF